MEQVIVNIYVIEFQYLGRIKAFRLNYLDIGNQWSRHYFIIISKYDYYGENWIGLYLYFLCFSGAVQKITTYIFTTFEVDILRLPRITSREWCVSYPCRSFIFLFTHTTPLSSLWGFSHFYVLFSNWFFLLFGQYFRPFDLNSYNITITFVLLRRGVDFGLFPVKRK